MAGDEKVVNTAIQEKTSHCKGLKHNSRGEGNHVQPVSH